MESAVPPAPPPRVWLVDGFNVMHASVLSGRERGHWWREPDRSRLLDRVRDFVAAETDDEVQVWVVFDGRRPAPESARDARLHVVFAPDADSWVLARLREADDPERVAVVTRDRRLAARARHRGARVVAPRSFLARCGSSGESPPA